MDFVLPNNFNRHVLICGSRVASDEMRQFAYEAVERVNDRGWTVVVGDCPVGVDLAVVQHCLTTRTPFLMHYCKLPRIGNIPEASLVGCGNISYTDRDHAMVRSSSIVLAVWNGTSPGTREVIRYACKWPPEQKLVFKRIFR